MGSTNMVHRSLNWPWMGVFKLGPWAGSAHKICKQDPQSGYSRRVYIHVFLTEFADWWMSISKLTLTQFCNVPPNSKSCYAWHPYLISLKTPTTIMHIVYWCCNLCSKVLEKQQHEGNCSLSSRTVWKSNRNSGNVANIKSLEFWAVCKVFSSC